ncbi:FAD-binding oxidoreductase [Pseudoruegeria sp. SK021]|uniref:FAD-binding oxidoreductase n=1 Tax=Pseudoruegeria sp. SK021 TaxID=1933035 RepID=UPI000A23FC83|nr:FAD-binding oxidoreductase [Pseudoruegeria sp. SK021]OSP55843.1 FAD-linked oxidase [Pseudoruegeria sp. SK021]
MTTTDIAGCKVALARFDLEDSPATVRQKSRDFFWYSPILKRQLADVTGDFVVSPRTEAEVSHILATCWQHNVPVTVRGSGTGNYGQAMPLAGGCILHLRHLTAVTDLSHGHITAQSGAIIADLEKAARATGQEIRLFPSTVQTATIGGFIAGGSSGVGAIRWGGLRNPANIRRLRLTTMEETPRQIDLTGADIPKASHAYGVNGVITEVEIPLDPATDWVDVLIGAERLEPLTELAMAIGDSPAIDKRMLSVFEAAICQTYFLRHRDFVPATEAVLAAMISADTLPALEAMIAGTGASIRFRADQNPSTRRLPHAYELGWNHTTLRALRVDPAMTYLQMMFPRATCLDDLDRVKARFGDEVLIHLELTRFDGVVTPVGIPLIRFTSEERLEEIVTILEGTLGLPVFNPHRVTLEEGGMKRPDLTQLAFKRETDPKGLMNPGKMIAWTDPGWTPTPGKTFLFNE